MTVFVLWSNDAHGYALGPDGVYLSRDEARSHRQELQRLRTSHKFHIHEFDLQPAQIDYHRYAISGDFDGRVVVSCGSCGDLNFGTEQLAEAVRLAEAHEAATHANGEPGSVTTPRVAPPA